MLLHTTTNYAIQVMIEVYITNWNLLQIIGWENCDIEWIDMKEK